VFRRLAAAMLGGVLCLVPAHRASGQTAAGSSRPLELTTLPIGTPLRFECGDPPYDSRWCYGSFRAAVGDTLRVIAHGDTSSVPVAASRLNVEANPGRHWSRRTHVLIGAIAGAALGVAAVYRNTNVNCPPVIGGPCGLEWYVEMPLTFSAGTLGGMLVGAVWPAARWERVSATR
jgi:hypothetical protein